MISEIFAVSCDIMNWNQLKWRKFGSASVRPYRNRYVAPLFASKESPFWYILTLEKRFKGVIIHERPTNVSILPAFQTCAVFYNTLSVIKNKC